MGPSLPHRLHAGTSPGATLDPFTPLLAGLGAGAIHVLSGPDHLAAVLPLAVEQRGRAAAIGAAWGIGHGAGVLVLGALGQLLKGSIDIEAVSAVSEVVVGLLLVGLGAWALWRSWRVEAHKGGHSHSAFGFGLLHGTAGAGHLFGVLPSLVMGPGQAAVYLGAYVVAAVGAMALFASGAGQVGQRVGGLPLLMRGSGLVALGVGVYWVASAA